MLASHEDNTTNRWVNYFWLTLILTFIVKCLLTVTIPVTGDEAYYYIWGMFPAGGGYDHTPMIGWLLHPFLLISHQPLILRLPTVLTTTFIGWLLYRYLEKENRARAAITGILFLISPLPLCAMLITTDTPVILFSTLSGLCVLHALRRDDHLGWFALGGLFLGLAFFSKYFAVLLALAYAVHFLILAPNKKRVLGLFIIFLGVLPFGLENLYWNYTHAWANILFNVYNRNDGDHFGIANALLYVGTLLYIFTPPLCYYLAKYAETLRQKTLLNTIILVPILFFFLLSFFKEIGMHWPFSFIPFVYLWAGITLPFDALKKTLRFLVWFTLAHLLLIEILVVLPVSTWQHSPLHHFKYPKIVYFFKHKQINDRLLPYAKNYTFTSLDYVEADMWYYDTNYYAPTFGTGTVHGRQDDLMTDFKNYAHKNFLIFYSRPPRPAEYEPYFASSTVHQFKLDGARFYYVLGQDFNYPVYRDKVLRYINDTYWQIPAYLPHAPSFFCERYFAKEGCHS